MSRSAAGRRPRRRRQRLTGAVAAAGTSHDFHARLSCRQCHGALSKRHPSRRFPPIESGKASRQDRPRDVPGTLDGRLQLAGGMLIVGAPSSWQAPARIRKQVVLAADLAGSGALPRLQRCLASSCASCCAWRRSDTAGSCPSSSDRRHPADLYLEWRLRPPTKVGGRPDPRSPLSPPSRRSPGS